jgi:hypothetical protein
MRHTVLRPQVSAPPAGAGVAPQQRLGSLIGGIFGLIYVEANVGQLSRPWPAVLQIAAGVAFAGLVALLARARVTRLPAGGGFGGGFWLVVVGEAVAIVAGAAVLNGPAGLARAVVAWVSVVVGLHFVALAAVWRLPLLRYLGVAITLCGAAGLTAAFAGAPTAVVGLTGGVLPGVLLLTAGYLGAIHVSIGGGRMGHARC